MFRSTLAILCFLFAACASGPSPEELRETLDPAGASVRIEYRLDPRGDDRILTGELLAIEADTILVRNGSALYRLSRSAFRQGRLDPPVPRKEFTQRDLRDSDMESRLRAVSRFPQGVSAELLQALQARYESGPVRELGGVTVDPVGELNTLVREARRGTAAFHDRHAAIAAGYRRLGADFPGMGEHWVHPGLVVSGRFLPDRPQMLSYVEIDGRPTLTGVAYAFPETGRPLPATPIPASAWHGHTESIDEETFGTGGERSGSSLRMAHLWVWTDNPAGVFVKNNWALPFARLGLPVPERFPSEAARALALASGAEAFWERRFRESGPVEPENADSAAAALASARTTVERLVADARAGAGGDSLVEGLRVIWERLCGSLESASPSGAHAVCSDDGERHHSVGGAAAVREEAAAR